MSYLVGKSGVANSDSSTGGVLPFTGVSPAALLLLLHRFSFRSARHGGLTTADGRLNALWFLEALLEPVMGGLRGKTLSIDLVKSWVCVYPRPQVFSRRVDFAVDEGGLVDISAWGEAAVGRASSFAGQSWELLRSAARQPLHISELLNILGRPDSSLLEGVFAQLIFDLGFRLHSLLLSLGKQGSQSEGLRMRKSRHF